MRLSPQIIRAKWRNWRESSHSVRRKRTFCAIQPIPARRRIDQRVRGCLFAIQRLVTRRSIAEKPVFGSSGSQRVRPMPVAFGPVPAAFGEFVKPRLELSIDLFDEGVLARVGWPVAIDSGGRGQTLFADCHCARKVRQQFGPPRYPTSALSHFPLEDCWRIS